jgi:hypothetical protein
VTYLLIIFLLLAVSAVFFPIGVGLDYSRRGRKWTVIWMGIRVPVPHVAKKLSHRIVMSVRKRLKLRQWSSDSEEDHRSAVEKVQDFIEAAGRSADMLRESMSALGRMSHHLHIRLRRMNVTIASANPALTGFSYGVMCAFAGALPSSWQIHADPDFVSTTPRVSFRVEVVITPFRLLPDAIRFMGQVVRKRRSSRPRNVKDSGHFAVI